MSRNPPDMEITAYFRMPGEGSTLNLGPRPIRVGRGLSLHDGFDGTVGVRWRGASSQRVEARLRAVCDRVALTVPGISFARLTTIYLHETVGDQN